MQGNSDVKLLYKKAEEVKQQIINVSYEGNLSHINSHLNITGKLKITRVRIVEIPKYRMVLSNYFYDLSEILRSFDKWFYEYNEK